MKEYDLIVAGTGFASSFFLYKFLQKAPANLSILVLERGEFFPHSERLEILRANQYRQYDGHGNPGEAIINKNPEKIWAFDLNFGGGSNCWTGCTPRFLPNDFQLKSKYGVGYDWPISYEELSLFYDEAEEIMQISGPDQTPFPKKGPYPLPAHSVTKVDQLLIDKYGVNYMPQATARASKPVKGRNACCSSTVCRVCPVNAKFTIENSLADVFKDPRVEIRYGAQVIRLSFEAGKVKAMEVMEKGERKEYKGNLFALGANAIFNAHILLNSGDKNPNTGKGLTEQVGRYARIYFDGLSHVGGSSIITANGYMMYDGDHRKERAACIIESFNTPYIRNERGRYREIALFKFIFEDLPEARNYVAKSENELKPEVAFSGISGYTQKGFDSLDAEISKYFSFLPIEKIELDDYNQSTEYHICSTTRMGNDKTTSVIDAQHLHHEFRNVLVLGSGVFPSITPANPTLTIAALSLRAADKLF